jgi:hypothetical protein
MQRRIRLMNEVCHKTRLEAIRNANYQRCTTVFLVIIPLLRHPSTMIFAFNSSPKRADATHELHSSEDDSSLSSTLTVDRPVKPQSEEPNCNVYDDDDQSISTTQTATSSSIRSVTKSVRFNLIDTQFYSNQQLCKEDCIDLWYTAGEYRCFKSMTVALAREVTKTEAKNRAVFSYERVMMRAYEVCKASHMETYASPLSADDRKHLRRWAEVAPSRLGLEKWAVRPMNRDRGARRSQLYDAVLDLQDSLKDDDALEECLRRHSERISLPSRLFARCMADAQAAAVESTYIPEGFAC